MDDLLTLRWQDRDRGLAKKFLAVKEEMNRRGIIHSSITIQELHEVAKNELEESRTVVVDTIIDAINRQLLKFDRPYPDQIARQRLSDRKDQIESHFKEHARGVQKGLQNDAMTSPYMNLNQYNEHALSELSIELAQSLDRYERDRGANTRDRILNSLLNMKVIAAIVIIVTVLAAALGLILLFKKVIE